MRPDILPSADRVQLRMAGTGFHELFGRAVAGEEFVVVYYSAIPDDKFMVYDFWFRSLDEIRAEMQRRLGLRESGAEPRGTPPLPARLDE